MANLVEMLLEEMAKEELKSECEDSENLYAKAKKEAKQIAELNKILFDAHIKAGFNEEAAFTLTVAFINSL